MRWLELPNFDSTVTGRRAQDKRLVAAVAGAVAGASYLAPTYCIAGETAGFGAAGLCSAIQPSPPDQIRSNQLHAGLKLRLKLRFSTATSNSNCPSTMHLVPKEVCPELENCAGRCN
jgi:hypothetical protein